MFESVEPATRAFFFNPDGTQLLVSTSVNAKSEEKEGLIFRLDVEPAGDLEAEEPISLKHVATSDSADPQDPSLSADGVAKFGANQLPAGMAFSADGKFLYAAINLANCLVEIDLSKNAVTRQFPVGNAPYDVTLVGHKAYVSNFAGRLPFKDDPSGPAGRGQS